MFDGVHFYYTFGLLPYQLICQLSLAILHKIKVESDQVDNEERASYKALRHFLNNLGPLHKGPTRFTISQ